MEDDTFRDGTNDVNALRILAPSGDHFMLNISDVTTFGDVKLMIYNSWPKGIESGISSHNKQFLTRTCKRRQARIKR
jgi:hypothetical protein